MKKQNSSAVEILKKLKSSKRILITLHKGPDGDSLGACCAMKYFLERDFNSKVTLISKDELPYNLTLLKFSKEIQFGKSLEDFDLKDYDLVLFLDISSLWMIAGEVNLANVFSINIDHHNTNYYYANLNYVKEIGSACSVLLELFREWGIKLDEELSTRLLLGIYTDTGGFLHDGGNSLKEAVFLVDHGADYKEIVDKVRFNDSIDYKKHLALAVKNFKVKRVKGVNVGYSIIPEKELKKLKASLAEVRGAPNYLQEIGNIDLLFTLDEMDDMLKGSFRSRKKVNVARIAEALGGGGHKFAAGFYMKKMPLREAKKKIFDAIKSVGIHYEN